MFITIKMIVVSATARLQLMHFIPFGLAVNAIRTATPFFDDDFKSRTWSRSLPYCSHNLTNAHTYRPLFLPKRAFLLRIPPTLSTLGSEVPVVHTEDRYPVPFYYYGEGCSDMYIHVNRYAIAFNRVHLLLVFKGTINGAADILFSKCARSLGLLRSLPGYNGTLMWVARKVVRAMSISARASLRVPGEVAAISSGMCAGRHLNNYVYATMVELRLDTVLLNCEFPGIPDHIQQVCKAELIHRGRTLYDRRNRSCTPHPLDLPCAHCGADATPLAWTACG